MYMGLWIVLGLATFAGCWLGTASLAPNSSSIPIDGRLHTFTLHDLQTSPDLVSGNWTNALEACQREGSQLAAVRSQQVQKVMEELQRSVNSSSGTHHAWVSGRRSPDSTWRDLNGQTVKAGIRDHSFTSDPALCGLAEYRGDNVIIYKNRCTRKHSLREFSPLCQTPKSSQESCPMGFPLLGIHGCYALLSERTSSWLTARQQCQELATGVDLGNRGDLGDLGDLAYSGIDQAGIRELVLLHGRDPKSNDTNSVWVGVMSEPWMWWTTANLPSAANRSSLVTYQAWVHTEGASDNNETCMALDLGQDARWIDVACDLPARYYVCQRDEGTTVLAMTSMPTEGPLLTGIESPATRGGGEENYTSVHGEGTTTPGATSYGDGGAIYRFTTWILVAMLGFFLLLVLPLVIVCIRRKSEEKNRNTQSISPAADVTSHAAYVQDEEAEPHRDPARSDARLGVEPASDDSHVYYVYGARDSHEYAGITPDLTPDYDTMILKWMDWRGHDNLECVRDC
nr:C-type lectin domain-containing receptor 3 [Arenicola marina]